MKKCFCPYSSCVFGPVGFRFFLIESHGKRLSRTKQRGDWPSRSPVLFFPLE